MISIFAVLLLIPLSVLSEQDNITQLLLNQNYNDQIRKYLGNEEISPECSRQLRLYWQGLNNTEEWALKMFDASTKFPTGILAGDAYDLGNFDECLDIETEEINGKYCLGTVPIDNQGVNRRVKMQPSKGGQLRMIGNDPKYSGLHFALCIPEKCNTKDISNILLDEKYCYTKNSEPQFTWGPITACAILGVFLLIVFLSTSYDVFLHYTGIKPGRDITIAFSYLSNGKKLLTFAKNQDQLLCLNGIKAISMIWIVLAHEYVNGASGAVANYFQIGRFIQDPAMMYVIGATVAVDSFFVVGGLVTVYSFLNATDKGIKFNVILYYIHRYIRLTPALAVVILTHATLLKFLGNGPLWNSFDDHLVNACRKHWWAGLLYIQNYVHDEQACVPQSWYLSIDMQLFILSPIILLSLKKKPKLTMIGLIVLTIAGIIVPFFVAFFNELRAFMLSDKDEVQKYIFSYYEQTYGRFGAYVIGMILGNIIYKLKIGEIRIKLNWWTVLSLWTVCLAGLVACVYAGHDVMLAEYNKWSHSLYIAFNRPAWALAISGVIFACVAGYGGPIDAFLSAPIFQFLAKISYSIYLVHYGFILVRVASYKTDVTVEHFYVIFNFWGDFMMSMFLAVILCLTFESPMITIEKLLFGKRVSKTKERPLPT